MPPSHQTGDAPRRQRWPARTPEPVSDEDVWRRLSGTPGRELWWRCLADRSDHIEQSGPVWRWHAVFVSTACSKRVSLRGQCDALNEAISMCCQATRPL